MVSNENKRDIDIVLVEDDDVLAELIVEVLANKKVDVFLDPTWLLKTMNQYHKEVKICLDYEYCGSGYNGIEVAKILHEHGFTRLYLHSGMDFKVNDVPDYLTVIAKGRVDKLLNLLQS